MATQKFHAFVWIVDGNAIPEALQEDTHLAHETGCAGCPVPSAEDDIDLVAGDRAIAGARADVSRGGWH